jgi:Rrf2 family protein
MWISRRTDYATRAVLALALVTDERPRKIHELAELTSTPESVLEQLLPQLRGAGIVRSERGPSGGYRLNHPPAEITLGRVVRLIQGPLAPIPCATRSAPEPCPMDVGCALQQTWAEVRDATIAILDNTTFADLVARSGGRWDLIREPVPVSITGAAPRGRVAGGAS